MVGIIWCGIIIAYLLISFALFGRIFCFCTKIQSSFSLDLVIGAFVYFGLFSIFAVPMIMMHCAFNVLYFSWLVVAVVLFVLSIVLIRVKEIKINYPKLEKKSTGVIIVALVLFVVQFYVSVTSTYVGWDTVSYIKFVDDAVFRNTMYINWSPSESSALSAHYGMSSYYMLCAVFTKLSGKSALLICKAVFGGLCNILSVLIVYFFGKEVFDKVRKSYYLVILWLAFNSISISIYTPEAFIMQRSYEAKAWCGVVIIPALIVAFYHLYKHLEEKHWWWVIGLIGFTGNLISESALLIIPCMISAFSLIVFISIRKSYIIRNWILCMIPSIVYIGIYVMNTVLKISL